MGGILIIALLFNGMSACGVDLIKKFGGAENDYGYSIRSTNDGYILAGMNDKNAWLIKTDKSGNMNWQKIFGIGAANSVALTNDGNCVVTGAIGSKLWLAKINKTSGAPIWERTFGATGNSTGESVSQTTDGGYIIAGTTDAKGAGKDDVWLIKTDSNGIIKKVDGWEKTFGWIYDDRGIEVHQVADGYILAGTFGFTNSNDKGIRLIKTDLKGNLKWRRTFSPSYPDCCDSADYGASVIPIKEGSKTNYLMSMAKCPDSNLACDGWLFKINDNGTELWEKNIGDASEDTIKKIRLTKDGKGLIAVGPLSESSSYAKVRATKTDLDGKVSWSKNYMTKFDGYNIPSDIDTTQSGYAIIGSSYSLQNADQQLLLIIVNPSIIVK